jgi:hypothetical protein
MVPFRASRICVALLCAPLSGFPINALPDEGGTTSSALRFLHAIYDQYADPKFGGIYIEDRKKLGEYFDDCLVNTITRDQNWSKNRQAPTHFTDGDLFSGKQEFLVKSVKIAIDHASPLRVVGVVRLVEGDGYEQIIRVYLVRRGATWRIAELEESPGYLVSVGVAKEIGGVACPR